MSVTFSFPLCPEEYQVNLANVNARMILELLGFSAEAADPGMVGELDAATLALRCIAAIEAIELCPALDGGKPSTEERLSGGAVWIDCGKPAGYLKRTLDRLRELAIVAGTSVHYY